MVIHLSQFIRVLCGVSLLSYVYTNMWAQDGCATINGHNVYTEHAARNGPVHMSPPRLAFKAVSHV